ncbi:MAG: hypothetical protein HN957_14665 [Gammaproteobacteria bacterium]|nr:hypothetical protein [Gammaproteobacteria bacterium]
MLRYHNLSVMLLWLYTTQLAVLTGRIARVGWEQLARNVTGMGLLV